MHAPLATRNRQRKGARSDGRRHLDPRKTCGSGRPSGSWSLGRRSAGRRQKQLQCDADRTPFTLRHADPGAQQRNGSCSHRVESACSQAPRHAKTLVGGTVDWRWRNTRTSQSLPMCRFTSAIRKAPGNAARMKTPICSYGNTSRVAPSVGLFSRADRPGLAALESTTQKDLMIPHSRR
jgi:hypothetical protein